MEAKKPSWKQGQPSIAYRLVVGVWLAAFIATSLSAYNGWRLVGGHDKIAAFGLAIVGYLLVVQFRGVGASKCPWTVSITDDVISTSDGRSDTRKLPADDLRRVVIVTDDSGPWGDDVLFYLFANTPDPVGVFPLEATGCQDFLAWLGKRPGFREKQVISAMGSTSVAEFEIFNSSENVR